MTPVIKHIRASFSDLPLPVAQQKPFNWTFDAAIKQLGPDFYCKIISVHPVLNLEYSVLCNQLQHHFSFPDSNKLNKDQIIDQLSAALMLAELLEHLHLHYLIVPREVTRLRRQQEVYRKLLTELGGYSFPCIPSKIETINPGLSFTQQLRDYTGLTNWLRLLLTRSKRLLNFLDLFGTGSEVYRNFVAFLDKYTNPFFAHLAWFFFVPRLLTNLFIIGKHCIPGFWMDEEEEKLEFLIRLQSQIMRRWFELGNDFVWVAVGLLNCFLFVGALAPVAVYATLFAFAFDIANVSFRAYIELNRLYTLHTEYTALFQQETNEENQKTIEDYKNYLTHRIQFEHLRLGLSVANAVAVFIAMSLAIPLLVSNPLIPLIGAFFLIGIWTASFTLNSVIEQYRPNDTVEPPSNLSKLGFFAPKSKNSPASICIEKSEPEITSSDEYSFC